MFLGSRVWPLTLLLHHTTCYRQQAILFNPFPLGLLSYNSRQTYIMLACGQAISAEHREAVPLWGSRLELQSLPWLSLFQGLLVHESGDSNSRLKRRGTSRSWGTGQLCGTDCRKLRLASWFFGRGSWAQALHLTLSLNFMCRHYRYVLCPALESPLWIHFQKPSVGYVGGQHALCMAKICSLSAVNSGNKIH